jgi:hypothetical protein
MLAYKFKRRLYYDSFIGLGELVDFGGKVNSYACALHAFTI